MSMNLDDLEVRLSTEAQPLKIQKLDPVAPNSETYDPKSIVSNLKPLQLGNFLSRKSPSWFIMPRIASVRMKGLRVRLCV